MKMGKEYCIVENKIYGMVAPDGGWGYMICVAAIINFLAMSMFAVSFGIIFKDFIVELDMGSTTVMLLSGINMMSVAFAGYFTGPLLRLISIRKLGLLAAFLFNIGVFCAIFVNTTVLFIFCQGIQNAGAGILYNLTCTQINNYFLKKRFLAISITQTATAAGSIVTPFIVNWWLESFGFRWTLVMISAVALQTFVAVALMQPVSRHMVRVELDSTTDEMKLLINEKIIHNSTVTTPTITVTDTEPSFDAGIDINNYNLRQNESKGSKNIMEQILDVQLLKKFLLSNTTMGPTFCLFADEIYSLMLPLALHDMGWNKASVTQAKSLLSYGDLITRALFVFSSKWLTKLGSQEVYLISIALAFTSRLCMLFSENRTLIMIFITFIGIARCSIHVLPPLIFADTYTPDKFTNVLGIYMMMLGLMNLILGPAIRAVRDLSNSYSTAFYVITSCYAVVLLLWAIELLYKRNKHKRILQREAAEKIRKSSIKNNKDK